MNNNQAILSKKLITQKNQEKNASFLILANNLLLNLDKRSQDIIKRRFGLFSDQKETLEKIGEEYNITRERIRQIISEILRNISIDLKNKNLLEAEEKIIFTINENNGIIKKGDIARKFNLDKETEINAVEFFANCSENIFEFEEKGLFKKLWFVSESILADARKVIREAEKIIEEEKKLFTDHEISNKLVSALPHLTKKQTLNFLEVADKIKKNKFEKWGMIDWTEVSPKGTREKVYLVLKEQKKPLHFTEIANFIDKFKLGKRKAHPQTVHNELIKDERFILIGRGIYALSEWGYFEGTIKEVIEKILIINDEPIDKNRIIEEILKIREVKKTTIMINLNNKDYFKKEGEFYSIKK